MTGDVSFWRVVSECTNLSKLPCQLKERGKQPCRGALDNSSHISLDVRVYVDLCIGNVERCCAHSMPARLTLVKHLGLTLGSDNELTALNRQDRAIGEMADSYRDHRARCLRLNCCEKYGVRLIVPYAQSAQISNVRNMTHTCRMDDAR